MHPFRADLEGNLVAKLQFSHVLVQQINKKYHVLKYYYFTMFYYDIITFKWLNTLIIGAGVPMIFTQYSKLKLFKKM